MVTTQPNYSKRIFTLLVIVIIIAVIYCANSILFPLIFAFIISILVRPIDAFLQNKWRFPKILSVGITTLAAVLIFAVLIFLFGLQLKTFMKDLPQMQDHITKSMEQVNGWVQDKFGVSYSQQQKYVKENLMKTEIVSAKSLGAFTGALAYIILIPIYIFLFLFYRTLLVEFLKKLMKTGETDNLKDVMNSIKVIMRSYIIGLLIEIAVVATLTSLGFWVFGIRYAIFLGLMTALLNLIPYIGILIANILCCLITLSGTSDYQSILYVLGVVAAVQLIDNNILLPRIVGSKVRINALASIVSVIVGGVLAGVPGMFLAIPVTAMLKIIFDAIPQFEPYGYLLGDEAPVTAGWRKKPKKK
jgi:predicted PurR-regulated permease PerM